MWVKHTQIGRCTHAVVNTQSSVSSPSWPITRSGLWSLPLDSLGLFWQLVRNTKRWRGIKVKRQGKGRCVCLCVCVSVRKIACVLGDSDFKKWTPCCAAITFKGRRVAHRALLFCCLWSSCSTFFCVFFTRNDALGTVCSLLRPACNSGFDRDEENANLV